MKDDTNALLAGLCAGCSAYDFIIHRFGLASVFLGLAVSSALVCISKAITEARR